MLLRQEPGSLRTREGAPGVADSNRLTTEITDPKVRKRLYLQAAVTGTDVKDLVTAVLDKGLMSLAALAVRIRESEATA